MTPTPRERRLSRAKWGEVAATVLAVLGIPLVALWPPLLPAYLGAFTLSVVGLTLWQYRLMDEFRRVRFLKAWAAAGIAGLVVWAVLLLAPQGEAGLSVPLTLPLWGLYLPFLVMLAAFFGVTAYLYRRDTQG